MANPFTPLVRALNGREHQAVPIDSAEQRIHAAHVTAAHVRRANIARHDQQLEQLHQSIRELGRIALPFVGTDRDITGEIEVIRPLPQDRLYSEKLRRVNTGQGFTRSEYMTGFHSPGSERRRFDVVHGLGYDAVRGIVLPFTLAGQQPMTKRVRVRPNNRPEDLAIALDDSRRTWAGILVPHADDIEPGMRSEKLPRFGVLEDPRSKQTVANALSEHQPVTPNSPENIVNRTRWLAKIEDSVIGLQQQLTPPTHPSHTHQPRP